MTKILLVLSSVRESRVADKVLELVKNELSAYSDVDISIADFRKTPLPFFDSPTPPSVDGFKATNENVQKWTEQVEEADLVLMLAAEYNYSYTPVLKNAIDWVFKPWNGKHVALISYGWAGGTRATKHLRDVLNSTIEAKVYESEANLYFMKDIDLEGNILGEAAKESVAKLLKEVIK